MISRAEKNGRSEMRDELTHAKTDGEQQRTNWFDESSIAMRVLSMYGCRSVALRILFLCFINPSVRRAGQDRWRRPTDSSGKRNQPSPEVSVKVSERGPGATFLHPRKGKSESTSYNYSGSATSAENHCRNASPVSVPLDGLVMKLESRQQEAKK
ncbi:hypothetical protein NPIL_58411 [Nephila pilipes]|uniref:Uncharacterized protein n=1 Tax=Nephila pilipes TaxID=299642 RepID=A0A8X6NKU9_NEPPI|nr:hypothetical protein NPIL_58411 [Nephila pilipes]